MDLRQIEYFVRVAELGSFTRAALSLGVAQPALSRQVRLLEVELRQTLLTRNGRGALPTEAGALLLAHGRGILHQVQRAREEIAQVRGALAGRVAVGLPPSVARVLTVPLTRAFRAALPNASLSIAEGLSVALASDLKDGRLDIALLYNAVPAHGLELVPLLEEELFLIERKGGAASKKAEPDSTISLQRLAAIPLVIPSRPNAIRMLVEAAIAGVGCRATVAFEIDGVAAILELVLDGAGCAVLSRNAVDSSHTPAAFGLRSIGPPQLVSRLSSAVSAHRPVTPTQHTMLELVRQTTRDALGTPQRDAGA